MFKELRIRANLTQVELAEKLKVTQQTISQWESGKAKPPIGTIAKIAETFSCDISIVAKCFI